MNKTLQKDINRIKEENQRLLVINDMLKREIKVLTRLLDESNFENERIQRYITEMEDYMKITDVTGGYGAY